MAIVITDDIIADADDYFSTRLNSEGWTGSDKQGKTAGLTTAANLLNSMEWLGRPATPDAAFPRYLPNSSTPVTPKSILWALYEQAIHLMNNPELMSEEDTVETIVVGPVQLQKIGNISLIPKIVKRYIGDYVSSSNGGNGGPVWWRAN